jgi:type II secretory pathway component GspD/PulD (secretin)
MKRQCLWKLDSFAMLLLLLVVLVGLMPLMAHATAVNTVVTTEQALGLQLPQGKRLVSISFQNVPLVQALKALAMESQFNVVVDATITDRISIEFSRVPLEQVLLALKRVGQLHYSLHNGTLMVSKRDSVIAQTLEQQQARIIQLRYTQASVVAQLINQTLQISMATGGTATATGSTNSSVVLPDANSNSLILKGDLTELLLVESLIAQIDKPRNTKTWHLSYANSVDVANFLASSVFNDIQTGPALLVSGAGAAGAGATATAPTGSNGAATTAPVKTESITEGTGGSALTPLNSSGGGSSSSGGSVNKIFTLRNAKQADGQITITGNGPILLPDSRLNTLTVMGTPAQLEQVATALETLDRRGQQIKLEVSVLELSESIERLFSPSYSTVINGKVRIGFNTTTGTTSSFNRSPIQPSNQLAATLTLLDQNRKLKVLSNPSVIAAHNQESIINVVDEVVQGFRTVTNQTGTPIARVATVVNAGIILNVLPKLGATGEVSLRINPIISFPQPNTGSATVRLISRRELVAQNVVLKSGESFVLGGLTQTLDQTLVNQIPGLAQLPILGALFKGQNPNRSRSELVIIITPHWLDENGQVSVATQPDFNGVKHAGSKEAAIVQPFSQKVLSQQFQAQTGQAVEISGKTVTNTVQPHSVAGQFVSKKLRTQQAQVAIRNKGGTVLPAVQVGNPVGAEIPRGQGNPTHVTDLF